MSGSHGGNMASKDWVKVITIVAGSGLLIASAFGQGKGTTPAPTTGTGGTPTGTTGGTTGTTTGRPTTPTNTNPTQPTQPTVSIPQPIFISGRVMMEDGTPPPEPVTIQTVCSGSPHSEGYTDGKGYFSIELGGRNAMIQDASEFGSFSSMSPGNGSATAGRSSSPFGGGSESQERKYMGC